MPDITPLFTVGNQILINFFDQGNAQNYTSHVIEDEDNDCDYIITMQKVDAETPQYQLEDQKNKTIALQAKLKELSAAIDANDTDKLNELNRELKEKPDMPVVGRVVVATLQHVFTKKTQQYDLVYVSESDVSWRTDDDHSELSYDFNVIDWEYK